MLSAIIKTLFRLSIFVILLPAASNAQTAFGLEDTVADYPCNTNTFFGVSSNSIRELQMNGNAITDMGVITTAPFPSILSAAYANDFMNGSTNRTFYSSVVIPPAIIKYDGVSWVTVASDSTIYHNAGGWGDFLYFQHITTIGQPNTQCISRLLPNGTLQKIFTDTSLVFTVADVETDSAGNVYFFRGPSVGNTSEMTVIDSTGNIVATYAADSTFNLLSFLYGTYFMNGTLYIAHGIIPPVVRPVIINGSTVSLGTAIPLPTVTSYKDMDNCFPSALSSGWAELNRKQKLSCSPNPFIQHTKVKIPPGKVIRSAEIQSVQGHATTLTAMISNEDVTIHANGAAPGIYLLKLVFEEGSTHYCRLVLAGND